ncbi:MAG: hypothetical protein H0X47_08910 [Nitrospirales bacterium]|nr:hypothetical protein [Nitrospirales bacterium]
MTWRRGNDVGGDLELTGKGGQARQLTSEICIAIGVMTYRLNEESFSIRVIPDSLYRESILPVFPMDLR